MLQFVLSLFVFNLPSALHNYLHNQPELVSLQSLDCSACTVGS